MITEAPGLPANHRIVLNVVRESGIGSHLDATEVLLRARRHQARLGLATVHRALGRLYERGLIAKVDVPGASSATYEPAGEQHAHFFCTVCATVTDVDYIIPKGALRTIEARENLEISSESIALRGRCARCRMQAQAAP